MSLFHYSGVGNLRQGGKGGKVILCHGTIYDMMICSEVCYFINVTFPIKMHKTAYRTIIVPEITSEIGN